MSREGKSSSIQFGLSCVSQKYVYVLQKLLSEIRLERNGQICCRNPVSNEISVLGHLLLSKQHLF